MKRAGGTMASRWALVIALLLAALLLVAAFWGVNWGEMLRRLARGHLDLLGLAALVVTTSYGLRGLRWRILLSAEKAIAPLTVFWAVVVGYLGNNFLPARAGEVIRSALLARRTGISASYVLATAVVERVLDAVALVLIGFLAVTRLPGVPGWLVAATRVMGVLALVGVTAFFMLPRLMPRVEWVLAHILRADRLRARVSSLLREFLAGMRAFQHIGRGAGFAALTAVIWLMDSLALTIVARAFDLSLALPQALLLLTALGLASAAPATPGYLGIFQFVAVTVLAPFGFSHDAALAFILAAQAVTYAVVLVWGTVGLLALGFRRSVHMPEAVAVAPRESSA